MASDDSAVATRPHLDRDDEAGTAPMDRRFRPDVEGLRAIAILLVVLYHAGVPGIRGGYVGVDVFFVISGFVITGVMLRGRQGTGGTSILHFYARRVRRILPAATLVILVAVLFTYVLLGVVSGNSAAADGRWAAAFLSNFHFAAVGTNYFSASLPPSPLQNYWSLSVEEQFYVVYPTLFFLAARVRGRISLQVRLSLLLSAIIVGSFWLSVIQTSSDPVVAYFSPFTRAWELALGALVAVSTSWLRRLPARGAVTMSWLGFAAIALAAVAFTSQTEYPGFLVAVPVVGSALIIAGGCAIPRFGVESLLGLRPFQWLGRRSYSLYLWHWPILIIAAERVGKPSLGVGENLLLVGAALAVSVASYALVENPIRHVRVPAGKTVAAGATLVVATILALSLAISAETAAPGTYPVTPATSVRVVLNQVAAAPGITSVPPNVEPPVSKASTDRGRAFDSFSCVPGYRKSTVPICPLGDVHGKHTMVVYGDSHALMWLPALTAIATRAHWRLVMLAKPACPATLVPVVNPSGFEQPNVRFSACDQWHSWALGWIIEHKPDMLIVSQRNRYEAPSPTGPPRLVSTDQWRAGLEAELKYVNVPGIKKFVLGSTPVGSVLAPSCLSQNAQDVQACSASLSSAVAPAYNRAEQLAAQASGSLFIDPVPWFCSSQCTAIVSHYVVYVDASHITATYAQYLQVILGRTLGFRG